jgi:imidazoleglycerol phosphate synthase glutamine amidotransferase subunit HisH
LDKFQNPPAAEKSQTDFIIQPGVGAMVAVRKNLRRVVNYKMAATLKVLNH